MEEFLRKGGHGLCVCSLPVTLRCSSNLLYRLLSIVWFGHSWISSLDDSFVSHGLEVVDSFRMAHRNDLKKAFSDNWLTALEEAGASFASRGGGSGAFATADEFRELFKKVVKETREGAGIALDFVVVLGRKKV